MRKKSREMDSLWALDVMRKAPYITVSFTRADGTAYGVPLSLACTSDEVWYFHCALEGDKLECHIGSPRSVSLGCYAVPPHGRAERRVVHSAVPLGHSVRQG